MRIKKLIVIVFCFLLVGFSIAVVIVSFITDMSFKEVLFYGTGGEDDVPPGVSIGYSPAKWNLTPPDTSRMWYVTEKGIGKSWAEADSGKYGTFPVLTIRNEGDKVSLDFDSFIGELHDMFMPGDTINIKGTFDLLDFGSRMRDGEPENPIVIDFVSTWTDSVNNYNVGDLDNIYIDECDWVNIYIDECDWVTNVWYDSDSVNTFTELWSPTFRDD